MYCTLIILIRLLHLARLSDASKMLRRLEKGLNNAKARAAQHEPPPFHPSSQDPSSLGRLSAYDSSFPRLSSETTVGTEDDDETDRSGDSMFPAQLIRKESERNSFFKTILNPSDSDPRSPHQTNSNHSSPTPQRSPSASSHRDSGVFPNLRDPVSSGLIDEKEANDLFEMFFLRLNPFINLFDPELHTVPYIRQCPFLFTTLLMACCKFFKPSHYKRVQKLAQEYAIRAFAENWKTVEVIQAFACLTYWQEPDDQRTWTYIGFACRMAVEMGLNKYVERSPNENDLHFRQRRNRERTYLVLFVHDRSLSTQTGRQYMLADDDEFIERASNWHLQGGPNMLPQDVIVASFVQLRLIASRATKEACAPSWEPMRNIPEECNSKMDKWMETWPNELRKAEATTAFHQAFIRFFWLYVRSFLNSLCIKNGIVTVITHPLNFLSSLTYFIFSQPRTLVLPTFCTLKRWKGVTQVR